MDDFYSSQAIEVGTKIVSFSSAIIGTHTDGIPPLQAKATLKLKLNYNCVRPAVWHAKLGYTGNYHFSHGFCMCLVLNYVKIETRANH